MLIGIEMLSQQASRIDQQLLLHVVLELQETNRLLRQIADGSAQGDRIEVTETMEQPKRPELMKLMAALPDKPVGFNKWSNEKMIEYLKEVS